MSSVRLIARLDVKGANLIKGVQMEGLRVVGDPHERALRYYQAGADELIYMDAVASLYGRNSLVEVVSRTAADVFIPITVGGGVRSPTDAHRLLRSGADKVAVNTAAVRRPDLIAEIARQFGSQAMVLSVEAKQGRDGRWEAYTDCGRERTGLDVLDWVRRAQDLGAGEILLTSVDREGTRKGFDVALVRAVASAVSIPVIASGGLGTAAHMVDVVREGLADAVAVADALHFDRLGFADLRAASRAAGIPVRMV